MTTEWWVEKVRESYNEFQHVRDVLSNFDSKMTYSEVLHHYSLVKILRYLDSIDDQLSELNQRPL